MHVELRAVTFGYRSHPVIAQLDLEILPGEVVALVGPSGSGKSTVLGLLGLYLRPDQGVVRWSGRRVDLDRRGRRERSAQVAWVVQGPNHLARRTALDNVTLPLLTRGMRRPAAEAHASVLLHRVGLGDRTRDSLTHLSGGEVQRVGVARALAMDPGLVLADEPTAQLDRDNAARLMDALLALIDDERSAVVATHDPSVAERCTRIVRLSR